MAETILVRPGQIWADNDKREVSKGTRQQLRVIDARAEFAMLRNEETGRESRVHVSRFDGKQFRLVADSVDPDSRSGADAMETELVQLGIVTYDDFDGSTAVDLDALYEYIEKRVDERIHERLMAIDPLNRLLRQDLVVPNGRDE